MINSRIFRQYDIRGHAGKDLSDEVAGCIAGAFAGMCRESGRTEVIIGRDNRKSSPRLHQAVVKTLLGAGLDVVDIGEVITPVFYFACHHLQIDAGLMITASHNPGEDNGFKIMLGASTIYGPAIQELAERVGVFEVEDDNRPPGQYRQQDVTDAYLADIRSRIQLAGRKLKIVVDCGNGTAGYIAPRLFRELGCEVVELYCDSDPDFPNHHPDPVNEANCRDLIERVLAEQADLGIGLDGDGDRLGVVDEKGRIIWGDLLMILFWREIMPRYPGSTGIVEVKCSQALIDEIERLGGKPVLYKTGHSLIKAKMRETGAVFTGEMSGHIFFADEYYGYDDALYAAARLLRIMASSPHPLSTLLSDIPRYYATPEIRVKSTDSQKFEVVERARAYFGQSYPVIDIDGARILFPDGWGLIRASNTGPELIVRCEGRSEEALALIKNELTRFLLEQGLQV